MVQGMMLDSRVEFNRPQYGSKIAKVLFSANLSAHYSFPTLGAYFMVNIAQYALGFYPRT